MFRLFPAAFKNIPKKRILKKKTKNQRFFVSSKNRKKTKQNRATGKHTRTHTHTHKLEDSTYVAQKLHDMLTF